MIAIPEEIRIKSTIKLGSVYYYAEKKHSTSTVPHYFVVLNSNPLTDSDIILINCSSRIDKVRHRTRKSPGTLVEVEMEEYPEFKDPISAFDGNSITPQSLNGLISNLMTGNLQQKPDMPSYIVRKLIVAVLNSRTVEIRYKKIISTQYKKP